ncbi:MAG: cupin domain-containing protein [Candidatus Omnitrophota bacterium]
MKPTITELIQRLGLIPHPEGGFFREIFRSPLEWNEIPGKGTRNASTAIYFLLPAGVFSAFHRVKGADEVWHHYLGDPVELHRISTQGEYTVTRLGKDMMNGEEPQVVIPADMLQGAITLGNDFSLCGCTVAPGFDFADFEMPPRTELLKTYPEHADIIRRLTLPHRG